MIQPRPYTFKLCPNKEQLAALEKQASLLNILWNACLEQRESQWRLQCQRYGRNIKRNRRVIVEWENPRSGLSYYDQAREIKNIRAEIPEYAEMSCASLELMVKRLDKAFIDFWRRLSQGKPYKQAGYPRYKSTMVNNSFPLCIPHRNRAGWKLYLGENKNHRVYAKGIPGKMKIRGVFPENPEDIRNMNIMRKNGKWYCSIVVNRDVTREHGKQSLEVDFNLLDYFALVREKEGGCAARDLQFENFLDQQSANHSEISRDYLQSVAVA